MDQQQKLRLVEVLASSTAKGNIPLADAVRIALEEDQAKSFSSKS